MKNEFLLRPSGDGFELLDKQSKVIAWTMDKKWAVRVLLGLELLDVCGTQTGPAENSHHHDDK